MGLFNGSGGGAAAGNGGGPNAGGNTGNGGGATGAGEPGKAYKYRCVERCVYGGRFWKPDGILELKEKRDIPHFVLVGNE